MNILRRAVNGVILGFAFAAALCISTYVLLYLFAYFAGPQAGVVWLYYFGNRA